MDNLMAYQKINILSGLLREDNTIAVGIIEPVIASIDYRHILNGNVGDSGVDLQNLIDQAAKGGVRWQGFNPSPNVIQIGIFAL